MICPKCKNKGFEPTEDLTKPIKNIGCKECFATVDYRRYVCLQCGYAFITHEKFEREVKVRRNQVELTL